MSNIRRSFLLSAIVLVASSAANGAPQKWCQSDKLMPINNKQIWYTANDIPSDGPMRKYRQFDKIAEFRLFVAADGRVKYCKTLQSFGERVWDESGCANLKRRARFNALTAPECSDVLRGAEYSIRLAFGHELGNETHLLTGVQ